MIKFLLQAGDTARVIAKVLEGDRNNDGQLSWLELFMMGGWIMIPSPPCS
ncbi:MAG: hypothetical protein HC867_05530 [Bacteroidia bacterium]|nr:hypothetical protein [Bacteroidia bacterium]